MRLAITIFLTFLIACAVALGIIAVVLYTSRQNSNRKKSPSSSTYVEPHSTSPVPKLTLGSPSLGPIKTPTQQPGCGVIWNNVNVNYGIRVDNSLGPQNPEVQAL